MKIFVDVIGCRLNQSEVEAYANIFRAAGHQIVDDSSEADLAIVNTCAVTIKAAADSRKKIRQAARAGAAQIIATGCWATLYPGKAAELPGVSRVFVNQEKETLVPEILNLAPEKISKLKIIREPLPGDRMRTRAFIKIQEGCDNHCTYCLTRLARGKSRSLCLSEVKRSIQSALTGGANEIVLTGVQLGAWGVDLLEPERLSHLLEAVLSMPGIKRLRLSSIEPWDFEDDLLSLWDDDRLCRHLHLPLQSGHDGILRAMGRPITSNAYTNLVENIRGRIPDIAITTDVITGFPGETVNAFKATESIVQRLGFASGHVFTYSPRPGTAAYKMSAQVPVQTAKTRNARLREIFKQTGFNYRDRFIGKKSSVLWETSKQVNGQSWNLSGLTDNYVRVYSTSDRDLWNQISSVLLEDHLPSKNALTGQVIEA